MRRSRPSGTSRPSVISKSRAPMSPYRERTSLIDRPRYRKRDYCCSIFPDMYSRAKRNRPSSSRGRAILPWSKKNYRNRGEVLANTSIPENELNAVIFDLESLTNHWKPRSLILQVFFWLVMLLAIIGLIVAVVLAATKTLKVWIAVLIAVIILLVAILLILLLNFLYKNYLIEREKSFNRRAVHLNRKIMNLYGTEMLIGTYGAWLEVLYDFDGRPHQEEVMLIPRRTGLSRSVVRPGYISQI